MTFYLMLSAYDESSPLNRSDQILVPPTVWTAMDREHAPDDGKPMFVRIEGSEVVGRLRPATPSDGLADDCCRLPAWMVEGIEGVEGSGQWIGLTVCQLPTAGHLILRARREADALSMEDPAATLSAAISGSSEGSAYGWACLSIGATLALACGVFDVIDIMSFEGVTIPAACILDCDLTLEFVPALDHVYLESETESESESMPTPSAGFIPFSGTGQRLGRN